MSSGDGVRLSGSSVSRDRIASSTTHFAAATLAAGEELSHTATCRSARTASRAAARSSPRADENASSWAARSADSNWGFCRQRRRVRSDTPALAAAESSRAPATRASTARACARVMSAGPAICGHCSWKDVAGGREPAPGSGGVWWTSILSTHRG
jgi:hypothetical protein